jgi:NAD(P)-dependent dehydrogenase (short-subunit alcohol dehydrogenase family)
MAGVAAHGVDELFEDREVQAPGAFERFDTSNVPLGRPNEPDDIADAVLFLLSDQARNISGQLLTVAGGSNPSL